MGKMRKKHLWSKFVNQQRTTKMSHKHWCFSHAFFCIGCTHTRDINPLQPGVFRGYRKATLGFNGLMHSQREMLTVL